MLERQPHRMKNKQDCGLLIDWEWNLGTERLVNEPNRLVKSGRRERSAFAYWFESLVPLHACS